MLDHISALMGIPSPSSSSGSHPTSHSAPLASSCSVDSLANRIGGLTLSDTADAKRTQSPSRHSSKDAVLVECAQCCGSFVKATASLDSEGKGSPTLFITFISSLIPAKVQNFPNMQKKQQRQSAVTVNSCRVWMHSFLWTRHSF